MVVDYPDKHTPGPWLVWDSKGTARIDHTTGVYRQLDSNDQQIIALCDEDLSLSSDEQFANARLIAAAPELLEALIWITDIANKNFEQDTALRSRGARTLKRIAEKAGAAIAKARGE